MSYVIKGEGDKYFQIDEVPFKLSYNFNRLFEFWEDLAKRKNDLGRLAKPMLDNLEKYKILKEPLQDSDILEEHSEILSKLFYPLFPEMTTNNEIQAVGIPFTPMWFNTTKRFRNIIENAGGPDGVHMRIQGMETVYITACVWILNTLYDAKINFTKSMYFDVLDQKSGINRHYRIHVNADFSEIKPNERTIPLTKEDIRELVDNFEDLDLWKRKIPPESYDYEGFAILKMFDVTREDEESSLRYNLLDKDALQSSEIIGKIKNNIRAILNLSEVEIGFASYDPGKHSLNSLGFGFWKDEEESYDFDVDTSYCGHTQSYLFEEKKAVILPRYKLEDVEKSKLLQRLHRHGLKSYIAAPILYDDKLIGVLELGSEKEEALNAPVANMLDDLIPLFTTALKRSQDELENQIEAIVLKEFTAIHPSVSWRFFDAASNYWKNKLLNDSAEMEQIVFPEVYPLFGQSDIKGSSTERNAAIQADMVAQLKAANEVMVLAIKSHPLPIYQKMQFRINKYIDQISEGIGAGDEVKVLEFMKIEMYPVFKHLEVLSPNLKIAVDNYTKQLDEGLHIIYNKRKDYEQSVSTINETVAAYIENAQEAAQKMFPHYFEKYQTDGVEHEMYIGASMVAHLPFNEVYLQNLRLWQLMITCEVENLVKGLQKDLPVPLQVASLVLVHSNPITINFRTEEKRFDVDGAYNVRYEIIKKRIDKALLKGTSERLTQVGKIAIIYSQAKEATEYRGYLEYLQSINYIGPVIEDVELHDMQGVTGLKALRVDVIYHEETTSLSDRIADRSKSR